jgi:acetolactate synthase-1/3 small subunit
MQDRPGMLDRAVGLFRRRGFHVDSLAIGRSEAPGVCRMTVVVDVDDVDQVVKQLYRLIEALAVRDVTGEQTVVRATALLQGHAPAASRAPLAALSAAFGATVVDAGVHTLMIELTATPARIESFIQNVRPFGIKEMLRSGRIAMLRGAPGHWSSAAPFGNQHAHGHGDGPVHVPPAQHSRWQADGIA